MDIFVRNKPYTGRLKAAILDWAGTCVDYGCLGPVAPFREAFLQHGVAVTLDEARGPMGVAKKDHVKALLAMPSVSEKWQKEYGREPIPQDVDDIYPDVEKNDGGRYFQSCRAHSRGLGRHRIVSGHGAPGGHLHRVHPAPWWKSWPRPQPNKAWSRMRWSVPPMSRRVDPGPICVT